MLLCEVFTTNYYRYSSHAKRDNYILCTIIFKMIIVKNIDVLLLLFYIVLRDVQVCKFNKKKKNVLFTYRLLYLHLIFFVQRTFSALQDSTAHLRANACMTSDAL